MRPLLKTPLLATVQRNGRGGKKRNQNFSAQRKEKKKNYKEGVKW